MLTDRIGRITPSATLAMTAKAAELRATGVDVINLSVGEPDFPTPENIRAAGKKAIDDGHTRYTPGGGTMELKKAVVEKMRRDNDLHYETGEIIISTPFSRSSAALAVIANVAEGVILPILSVNILNILFV